MKGDHDKMGAIYRKELRSYVNGMTGAIFTGFILLVDVILIASYNFNGLSAQF